MSATIPTRMVELRPVFKAKPGNFEAMKKHCKEVMVGGMETAAKTGTPDVSRCLQYNFVVNEEQETFICREGYVDAEVIPRLICIGGQRVS